MKVCIRIRIFLLSLLDSFEVSLPNLTPFLPYEIWLQFLHEQVVSSAFWHFFPFSLCCIWCFTRDLDLPCVLGVSSYHWEVGKDFRTTASVFMSSELIHPPMAYLFCLWRSGNFKTVQYRGLADHPHRRDYESGWDWGGMLDHQPLLELSSCHCWGSH